MHSYHEYPADCTRPLSGRRRALVSRMRTNISKVALQGGGTTDLLECEAARSDGKKTSDRRRGTALFDGSCALQRSASGRALRDRSARRE